MIVIRRPLQNDNDKPNVDYAIAKTEQGIQFGFKTTYMGEAVEDTVLLDFATWKGNILHISLQATHKTEVRVYPLYEMVSRYHTMSETNNDAMVLARVSISPDCGDIVIFLNERTNYECPDAQNVEVQPGCTKSNMMMQYSPFYTERANRIRKKWDMMANIDIYNSVTYLESQVDALTRLVLALTGNASSEAVEILQEADRHSVL